MKAEENRQPAMNHQSLPRRSVCVLAVLTAVSIAGAAPQLRIAPNGYEIVRIEPVPRMRGAFDVTARASVVNRGNPASGVRASLTCSSPHVIVLDGHLRFGDVPRTPGGRPVLSRDTFRLRIAASPRSNAAALERVARSVFRELVWEISCADCGGNRAPVANAGPDQTVAVGQMVSLDASGSTDPDGQPLTYTWLLVSGPQGSSAALSSTSSVNPTFSPDRQGDYIIRLTVNDGAVDSAPDTVQISTRNSAPVAVAGPDQRALVGQLLSLDGSGSTDVDGDPLTYAWRIVSRPDGSVATVVDPSQVKPTFTPDAAGTFLIELVVTDGTAASAPTRWSSTPRR